MTLNIPIHEAAILGAIVLVAVVCVVWSLRPKRGER